MAYKQAGTICLIRLTLVSVPFHSILFLAVLFIKKYKISHLNVISPHIAVGPVLLYTTSAVLELARWSAVCQSFSQTISDTFNVCPSVRISSYLHVRCKFAEISQMYRESVGLLFITLKLETIFGYTSELIVKNIYKSVKRVEFFGYIVKYI